MPNSLRINPLRSKQLTKFFCRSYIAAPPTRQAQFPFQMTFTLARCRQSDITCAPLLLNAVIFLVLLNLTILVAIALRDYRNRDPETRRLFFRFGKYHDFRSSKFAVTGHAPNAS